MPEEPYGCGQLRVLAQGGGCSVFQAKNESGEGTVTLYEVFPGVTLAYNDFHMQYFQSEFVPNRDIFCIDHCREGRLEYPAREDAYAYVEAGDLKLDRRLTHTGLFEMPLSHYHGLMVTFDMEIACASLPDQIKDFPVDLRALQNKYCPGRSPLVLREPASIEHICGELYAVPQDIQKSYFKIKILELLLYLQALELPETADTRPYFYKTQIEKIKAIQRFLTENIGKNYTQEELSERFGIPLTPMKQCFKSVYGCSIGNYVTQYRMNRAAVLLRQNHSLTVTEIAGRAGYDSPSKFAMAFRRVMGMSPVEYRKK